MSLYQPSYMQPRNSTIDSNVKDEMVFSCQLNGNSLLFGYDIMIYDAGTNELVYQLTSDTSKEIMQNELQENQDALETNKSEITKRESLLEQVADDETDSTFRTLILTTREECETILSQMEECISGSRPTSEFFTLGDQVIDKVTTCRTQGKAMQQKIETTYLTVLEEYQKRMSNNSIQLDTNITRYKNTYKGTNQITDKTISVLNRILDYATDNVSDDDTSLRTILAEYWDEIQPTLQEDIDNLEIEQDNLDTEIESLQTAINNLGTGMYILSDPIYPVDYLGNNVILQHQLPAGVVENGGDYKWSIVLYWSSTERKGDEEDLAKYEAQLEQAKADLNTINSNISAKQALEEQYSEDSTYVDFKEVLDTFEENADTKIDQMRDIIKESDQSQFWVIGDQVIAEAQNCITQAESVKERIEGTYGVSNTEYQTRYKNNQTLLNTYIESYQKEKSANNIGTDAIVDLVCLADYITSTTSTENYSTRTITGEYWDSIENELLSQISTLEDNKEAKESEIVTLETTIANDGLDQSIVSQEAYFECRTTPTIQIQEFPNPIDKKYYEFQGLYTQPENVPVTYFRWILKNAITGEVLKDTDVIPSPDLRFYYDGFLNDYKYTIQLIVTNQNNITVQTDEIEFKVAYVEVMIENFLTATSSTDEHGIIVEWSGIHGVSGTVYGDYTYIKDIPVVTHTSLQLPKGSSIVFDRDNDAQLKIPAATAAHIISIRIDDPGIETIYEATGSNGGLDYYKRLTLEGNELVYDINGMKEIRHTIIPSTIYWYVIFMLPDKLIVSQKIADGLFPATDLYPHVNLYPKPLTYVDIEGEVLI